MRAMKTLFLYYSNSGNGEAVAEKAKELGADLCRVERHKKLPKGFFGIFAGGFSATRKKKDKLKDFSPNIEGYERIIIGSPIWNARLSCPINTVLDVLDLKDKKVDFLLYSGSGEAPKAVERIKKEYPEAKYVIMKSPKKYGENLKKVEELFE